MLARFERYRATVSREVRYVWRTLTQPKRASLHGVLLRLDRPHVSPGLKRMIYRETYEAAEMRIVEAHLQSDDVVLELGSGLGAVATLCARKLGDGTRVHAYEANPEMEITLRETFNENGVNPNLTIGYVSNQDGDQKFFIERAFCSSSGIRRSGSARCVEVASINLQRLIAAIQPSFLVVDVEGHEVELFGSVRLETISKICIELHPHIVGDAACSEVLARLISQGFAIIIDECDGRVFYLTRDQP
jgi:FkbM family methyltransferase